MEKIFRGEVLDFIADPNNTAEPKDACRYYEDGAIVVADGHIAGMGKYEDLQALHPQAKLEDYSGRLLMPGFIDTHIHYPQTQIIASHGKQLLDWLKEYTFPVEENFATQAWADEIAADFIHELLKNGTTTCAAFATVHKESTDALFQAAQTANMRIIAGKVLMERNAPESLLASAENSYADSKALLEKWHRNGRSLYAVTPRFAITCGEKELELAGRLHREYPDTFIQTHLSENQAEVAATLELFPSNKDYLDIYEQHGLLTERSIFAHGIYLSASEMERIHAAGALIAHCPTSNLFLGSGLYDMQRANAYGVKTAIATDVGAGTSFSLLQTLNEAYKVQQLNGYPMDAFESFYKITLGAARGLHLADKIGSFATGNEADFVVIDYRAHRLQKLRMDYLQANRQWSIEALLFGLQMLGDDRNIQATYLMGKKVSATE